MSVSIEQELEILTFEKDEEWKSHVEKFYHLKSKCASQNKPLSSEEKVFKFQRTLTIRFSPRETVAEASYM